MAGQATVAEVMKNKADAGVPAPKDDAAQAELRDLRERLRAAEARLAERERERPVPAGAAPGIYRVTLEGCRPRPATYTVRVRERLFAEHLKELAAARVTTEPVAYCLHEIDGASPFTSAWAKFCDAHKVPDDRRAYLRRYYRVLPESGPLQDHLDVRATSKGDAFATFCAINGIRATDRKYTAELVTPDAA